MRVNRAVTGTDENGRSTFIHSGPHDIGGGSAAHGVELVDLWRTDGPLADNESAEDTGQRRPYELEPPAGGSLFRLARFLPEDTSPAARREPEAPRTPHMHITRTTDYIVVIEGEIWAELEDGEILLKQGDTLIQRGTIHAWRNRSNAPCTFAAVMIDARPLAASRT